MSGAVKTCWQKPCPRWLVWAFFVFYAATVLWAVAPVMRESDQAALLDGAWLIARDGDVFGRSLYNYEKQYGTYVILAFAFRAGGLDSPGIDPASLVQAGNLISACVFLLGLSGLLLRWQPKAGEAVVALSVLLSPVVLFSAPLLSSNFLSAGFLCLLVACLAGESRSGWHPIAASLAAFAAVACRADAILVMPFVVLAASERSGWRELLGSPQVYPLVGACLVALFLGEILSEGHAVWWGSFWHPQVAFVYLVFGLGGGLATLILLLVLWGQRARAGGGMLPWLTLLAALVPLAFYARILFTPRHLTLVLLVLLFSVVLDGGRRRWASLWPSPAFRWVLPLLLLWTGLPLFLGVQLDSPRSGRIVFSGPTLYPTTDGYWPMGCHAQFVSWLGRAHEQPIDHNQRVWSAWEQVRSCPDPVRFYSEGLVTFGTLRLHLLGVRASVALRPQEEPMAAGGLVNSGRTLLRRNLRVGLQGSTSREQNAFPPGGEVLGTTTWEEIYRSAPAMPDHRGDRWSLRMALGEVSPGDDFLVGRCEAPWGQLRGGGEFRWLAFRRDENIPGEGWRPLGQVGGWWLHEARGAVHPGGEADWFARSALCWFMSASRFVGKDDD